MLPTSIMIVSHGGVIRQDGYTSKTRESRLLEGNRAQAIRFIHLGVSISNTTLLCSIFLPVLVKVSPCIGKDLGMCTEIAALIIQPRKRNHRKSAKAN